MKLFSDITIRCLPEPQLAVWDSDVECNEQRQDNDNDADRSWDSVSISKRAQCGEHSLAVRHSCQDVGFLLSPVISETFWPKYEVKKESGS